MNLYRSFYREPADGQRLLDLLGLTGKRNTQYRKLSGGQQQRLSVALALAGRPTVAVLDELTTGLDPQARRDTWDLVEQVRDSGVTIILVTHFMDEAERLCDRLALIDAGRVVALDTPAGLVASATAEQRVRFRPSAALDERLLTNLPEVTSVQRQGHLLAFADPGA
jgi:ABC-2 type transport system ATP-binding protein